MRFFSIVTIFAIISCATQLVAQDSLLVLSKIQQHNQKSVHFETTGSNPIQNLYTNTLPLLQVNLTGKMYNESTAILQQRGDGLRTGTFEAKAFQPITDSLIVLGNAFYRNGKIYNMTWNETSDMELLYPYLTADTIGGDLNTETYHFNGGYAQQLHKISLGAQLSYRALQEYRDIDPRPKNTVADLELKLGMGYKISNTHTIALGGSVRRYKQTNSIKYYSPLGGYKTYHLTGLGMDYVRFAGTNNSIYYKGNGIGATLNLIANKQHGLNATLSYNQFWFEKILSDLNNLNMAEMLSKHIGTNISYTKGTNLVLGTKLNAEYTTKNGTENLFGTSAGNVWTKIAEAKMYTEKHLLTELSGIAERNLTNKTLSITPTVGFKHTSLKYLTPQREIGAKHIIAKIAAGYSQQLKKVVLSANAYASMLHCTNKNTSVDNMQAGDIQHNLTINTAKAIQSSYADFMLNLRIDLVPKSKTAYFMELSDQYSSFYDINSTTNTLTLSMGLVL